MSPNPAVIATLRAPDLVIEILSGGTRRLDEGAKLARYARFGVREAWFLEPETSLVRIYRQRGETLLQAAKLSEAAGDVLSTPLLPGLAIPLADLFR